MNPLIHVQVGLELVEEMGLKLDRDLFVLGSVLPDIYLVSASLTDRFHAGTVEFVKYLLENDPGFAALGVGFMFHGESPSGLDYHAHRHGGFIDKLLPHAKPIVRAEHPRIKDDELTKISHSMIEFACDYLSSYEAANALNFAFKRTDLKRVAFHFSTFFGSPRKRIYRVLKFFRKFNFQELRTARGISSNVKKFLLWKDLQAPTIFQKYKFLKTQFYFMRKRGVSRVFNEVKGIVQKELEDFLKNAKKGMKSDLAKHIPPELS